MNKPSVFVLGALVLGLTMSATSHAQNNSPNPRRVTRTTPSGGGGSPISNAIANVSSVSAPTPTVVYETKRVPDESCNAELSALRSKIADAKAKCTNLFGGKEALMKGLGVASIVASGVGTASGAVGTVSSGMRLAKEYQFVQDVKKEVKAMETGQLSPQQKEAVAKAADLATDYDEEKLKAAVEQALSEKTFEREGRKYTAAETAERIQTLAGQPDKAAERDEFINALAGMQMEAVAEASLVAGSEAGFAAGGNLAKDLIEPRAMQLAQTATGFTSSGVQLGTSIASTLASGTSLVTSSVLAGEMNNLAKRIKECESAIQALQ